MGATTNNNVFSGVMVITPEKFYIGECEVIKHIIANGSIVHIRKPDCSTEELRTFCSQIVERETNRELITIHYNPQIVKEFDFGGAHIRQNMIDESCELFKDRKIRFSCSTHTLKEALECENSRFSYYFLSPIFDSISKSGYKSNFITSELTILLKNKNKCVALGGVKYENLSELIDFYSAALLGSIWVVKDEKIDIDNSIERFNKIEKLWRELKNCNI